MSRLAPLFVAAVVTIGADASAAETKLRAVYWQPYSAADAATPARVRQALAHNLGARGLAMVDGSDSAPTPTPLVPALTAALDDYRAFHFADAVGRLDALDAAVRAAGGGELDTRQLADLYLFRALSRSELGQADAAWDDFVRAARLEPTRLLDPARFAPRAVAAYGRAAAEALAVPLATVELAPADAHLRVDGREATSPLSLAPGSHFVRAVAPGLAAWSGAMEVSAARQRIELPLTALRPSDVQLAERAGSGRAISAAVTRDGAGWRLTAHFLGSSDGTFAAAVDVDSAERVVDAALHQLLDPPIVAHAAPSSSSSSSSRRRVPWWVWTIVGGAATAAIVVPIAVVYGQPGNPSVGGTIGALR